jgi:hypothetical protein
MASEPSLPHAQYRRFESFREYEALFDTLIPQTQSVIRVFDRALPAAWNTQSRIELLRQFLRQSPANRLLVIVHDASNIERNLPRVAAFNRDFGHAFKIRQTPRMAQHLYDPFTVFDASQYLHRFHHAHMRAAIGNHDVEGAQQLLERHLELWEVSRPVSFASPSGL